MAGSAVRDYIHVSDLVAAHIAALKHQTDGGARTVSSELINQLSSPSKHMFMSMCGWCQV